MAASGLRYGMWTLSCSLWALVPWPGIEPRPSASGQSCLSPWTTGKSLPPISSVFTRQRFIYLVREEGLRKPSFCRGGNGEQIDARQDPGPQILPALPAASSSGPRGNWSHLVTLSTWNRCAVLPPWAARVRKMLSHVTFHFGEVRLKPASMSLGCCTQPRQEAIHSNVLLFPLQPPTAPPRAARPLTHTPVADLRKDSLSNETFLSYPLHTYENPSMISPSYRA